MDKNEAMGWIVVGVAAAFVFLMLMIAWLADIVIEWRAFRRAGKR